jgi:hypothetical protein
MALLTNPHWEVVPPLLREPLIEIGQPFDSSGHGSPSPVASTWPAGRL